MLKTIILALTISCLITCIGCEVKAEITDIHFAIERISPRVGQENTVPEAIVGLRFTNTGIKSATIPISAVTGKGSATIDMTRSDVLELDGRKQPTASSCAEIKYQWLNAENKIVLSDVCPLTIEKIELAPGGTALLPVPVKIPTEQGAYSGRFTFSNQALAKVLRTTNTYILNTHLIGPPAIFKETVSAKVEIGNSK